MYSTSFGIVTYVTYMHSTPFRIVTYVAYMHSTSFRIVTYVAYMHSTLTNLHLAYQRGRPMPDANSSRLVLEYMLVNRPVFVKAYHNRVYSYSSGSKFSEVAYPLQQWMEQLESQRAKNPSLPSVKRTLKLLNNVNNLHRVVGDTLISFVKAKPEPFLAHILKSKDHFWSIGKVFKFCMTFVFLLRYVFGYKSQHQWRKFTVRVVLCTCYVSVSSQTKPFTGTRLQIERSMFRCVLTQGQTGVRSVPTVSSATREPLNTSAKTCARKCIEFRFPSPQSEKDVQSRRGVD